MIWKLYNQKNSTLKATMTTIYDFTVLDINNKQVKLSDYADKTIVIVNVASKCGFTNQYTGLQELYTKYHSRGFEILAFPCNQFGAQEPGDAQEIKNFCSLNYEVTFPLFAKIEVNGKDASPLYKYLKEAQPGALGLKGIKWNFTKFLIDKSGRAVKRFSPTQAPLDLITDIEKYL